MSMMMKTGVSKSLSMCIFWTGANDDDDRRVQVTVFVSCSGEMIISCM